MSIKLNRFGSNTNNKKMMSDKMNNKPYQRPIRTLIIIFVVLIAASAGWYFFNTIQPTQDGAKSAGKNAPAPGGRRNMPLPPVQVATASEESVPHFLSGLGTVIASNTVVVRSRVDGQLMALHFTEGQQVKAGDLLAEIDPRPFEVALTQAQGQLAKDQATLTNARLDLSRYQQLAKTNLVSRQELDTQSSLVLQSQGSVAASQGAVDSAKLQLVYSRIIAPADGVAGIRPVDIGNIISSGDATGIVVLTQTHPIDVIFTLPEGEISTILQAQKAGQPLVVEAWDRTDKNKLTSGTLLTLDNQIDATTGTIRLKARFENQDDALFPNQFVNARLKVNTLQNAVVIPTSAVQMGNEGHFVWILDAENKVSKHLVSVGMQDSLKTVISSGVSAAERVVTDGIDRLIDGAQVEVISPQPAVVDDVTAGKDAKTTEKPQIQRKS